METATLRGNHLTRGRKFSGDELELMLLRLLGEQPQYGYEIIKAFATISSEFYRPSPGVLYPCLNRLEQRGHAQVQQDGKRKRYQLTEAGRACLRTNREAADNLFAILRHASKKMLWMRQAAVDEAAAASATGWLPEFVAARHALRRTLTTRSDANHEEQRRITAILHRAIAEINEVSLDTVVADT